MSGLFGSCASDFWEVWTATSVAMTLGSIIAIIIKYFQMKKSFLGSLSSQPTTPRPKTPSAKSAKSILISERPTPLSIRERISSSGRPCISPNISKVITSDRNVRTPNTPNSPDSSYFEFSRIAN